MHVPALSAATVYARGLRGQCDGDYSMLLELGNIPLPSELTIVSTLISTSSHMFPVQVSNLLQEDVWLSLKARLVRLS